jgi:hypothetical protein
MLETKTGNAAEINLFLVMMLREAGIKADPLTISTVSNGFINIASPNVSNMNFVIAAVQTKDGFHLYDATSKQSSIDQLPPRDWNQFGILMNKDKVQQLSMINAKTSFTYLTAEAKINEMEVFQEPILIKIPEPMLFLQKKIMTIMQINTKSNIKIIFHRFYQYRF